MISLYLHGVSTKKIPKSPSSIPILEIIILKESRYFKVRFEDQNMSRSSDLYRSWKIFQCKL